VSKASGKRLHRQVRQLRPFATGDTKTQPDVKGERQVHVGELVLAVQIGRIGDHPPAVNVRANVPDGMLMADDVLHIDLLQELDRQVGGLRGHVVNESPVSLLALREACGT
jgi:hypothetical protein